MSYRLVQIVSVQFGILSISSTYKLGFLCSCTLYKPEEVFYNFCIQKVHKKKCFGVVVIARLQSSIRSLLHQHRDLHQSTYLYLSEDQEPTSHQTRRDV
jgi:hypothetical protein